MFTIRVHHNLQKFRKVATTQMLKIMQNYTFQITSTFPGGQKSDRKILEIAYSFRRKLCNYLEHQLKFDF